MSVTAAPREGRIELRATREEKRLLTAAAAHERLDLTSFVKLKGRPHSIYRHCPRRDPALPSESIIEAIREG